MSNNQRFNDKNDGVEFFGDFSSMLDRVDFTSKSKKTRSFFKPAPALTSRRRQRRGNGNDPNDIECPTIESLAQEMKNSSHILPHSSLTRKKQGTSRQKQTKLSFGNTGLELEDLFDSCKTVLCKHILERINVEYNMQMYSPGFPNP